MRISGQGIKMCAMIKPHNIRNTIKKMEHAEMKLKTFKPRNVTLSISSTSSVAGGNANGQVHRRRGWGQHR